MTQRDALTVINEMVEGLIQAEGAASQLTHHLQDPRFMIIEQALALMKEGIIQVSPHNNLVAPQQHPVKKVIV